MEIIDAKVEESPKYEFKKVTIEYWNSASLEEQLRPYKALGYEVVDFDEQKWRPTGTLPHILEIKLRRAIKED